MDYGLNLQFGYFLTPTAANPRKTLELAQLCDQLGFDVIGIQDHPYQSRFFDTWTLLSTLAVQTKRVRFFPDVANLPLRPPVMLAKAVATLDQITGGRIELGLGSGAFWEAIAAMDGPVRKPSAAVSALEEAIQIIRLMWSGKRGVRFEGKYYQVRGAHSGPIPAHPIGIYIGALGPRMLELTGRLGDGWIPSSSYAPPAKLPDMQTRIDEAAINAGRSPANIRRMYNLMGSITSTPSNEYLHGPVEKWVDELNRLALEVGIDTFILGLPDDIAETQLRQFADEVMPRVRENVAALRQSSL